MNPDLNKKIDRINTAAERERLTSPEMIQKSKAVRYPTAGLKWFKLSNVAGDPMTGKEQTCGAGIFSDKDGALGTLIYKNPQSALAGYKVNHCIAALHCGDSWVAITTMSMSLDICEA